MNPARILILFLTMSTLTRERVESPQYTVVRSESDLMSILQRISYFDVRYYRESAWMTALIDDISFEKSTKNGFHRLFQYTEALLQTQASFVEWYSSYSLIPEYEPYEDEKLCVFLIEKALSKLPAGKQEMLVIMDLRGFQAQNTDLKFLTFVFDAFYYYYPRRLGQVLFVDAPFIFKPFWQLVKPLLKSYASLVRFCSAKEVREEFFTADTIPTSFR